MLKVAVAAAIGLTLLGSSVAFAQRPEQPEGRPPPPAADTLKGKRAEGEQYFTVDTIMVLEEVEGTVWGDWYVNPEVGTQVQRAIEREGQLSGRTWLESGAPIRDLSLDAPGAAAQILSFVDKGVALRFWKPGEVDYEYVFEGPWKLSARGRAAPAGTGVAAERMRIALRLPPKARKGGSTRERLGRLDITYRAKTGGIPRGRFTIYLYYVDARYGYRIAGVGY
jgi:hypothetical protein